MSFLRDDPRILQILLEIQAEQKRQDDTLDTISQNIYVANQQLRVLGLYGERILAILERFFPSPVEIHDFTLYQILGGQTVAINGTVLGTTSTFQIGYVPATNFIPLQSGPTVSVDDTADVTLGPIDPGTLTFTAAVSATATATSYILTISGVNDAGAPVAHSFNVPILPTPPPPAQSITDFSLNQIS
jgi:hypothetical protein